MANREALRQAWDEECGHLGTRLAALEHLQSSRRDESNDWTEITSTRVSRIERSIAELKQLLAQFGSGRTAGAEPAKLAGQDRKYPTVGMGKAVWTARSVASADSEN